MKTEKTIKVTCCDVYGCEAQETYLGYCAICGIDICREHCYVYALKEDTSVREDTTLLFSARMCATCFELVQDKVSAFVKALLEAD